MEFLKGRSLALLALGSLILAAMMAGGCAAPDEDEKARFGTVLGTVTDARGEVVVGATVTVVDRASPSAIGTRNYTGSRGPFVTDAKGQFMIQGVRASANDTVVLNILVEKAGFRTSAAGMIVQEDTPVPGTNRVIPRGAQTPDIVVNTDQTVTVTASLLMDGPLQPISETGSVVRVEVPSAIIGAAPVGVAEVSFPAGAVSERTEVSVTPVSGSALSSQATVAVNSPHSVVAPNNTILSDTSVAAVELKPEGLQFPPNARPTIRLPLALTLDVLPAGSLIPVQWYNPSTATWETQVQAVVEAVGGKPFAVFQVSHFSTYQCKIPVRYVFGPLVPIITRPDLPGVPPSNEVGARTYGTSVDAAGNTVPKDTAGSTPVDHRWSPLVFINLLRVDVPGLPPSVGGGDISTVWKEVVSNSLSFTGATQEQTDWLVKGFETMAGSQKANQAIDVIVPPAQTGYAVATKYTFSVTATVYLSEVVSQQGTVLPDRTYAGTRVYWLTRQDVGPESEPEELDPDVIKHIQGGGIEF